MEGSIFHDVHLMLIAPKSKTENRNTDLLFLLDRSLICVLFLSLSACRCACKYVCAFMTKFMWGSTKQCTTLPHQLSYDRPNIAQRKQCFLFSPAWPQSIAASPSVQHKHPLFPCLFSRDFFWLEKNTHWLLFFSVSSFRTHPMNGYHIKQKAKDSYQSEMVLSEYVKKYLPP